MKHTNHFFAICLILLASGCAYNRERVVVAPAKAAAFRRVTVPVVIEGGKTTYVHLDGSELSSGRRNSASEFVRLPDGLIVGWRATTETKP